MALVALGCAACGGAPVAETDASDGDASREDASREDGADRAGCVALEGARLPGGAPLELVMRDGVFAWAREGERCEAIDARGRFVAPGVIDAHVHLAYLPVGAELRARGVVAVLDLAAPMGAFDAPIEGLTVLRSGPMITAVGGYPTRSWGSDGYGLECDGVEACVAAVDAVIDAGAAVVKVPLTGADELDDATLAAVIERAHARDRRVAVHALSDAAAARAARLGADLLAHTPTERLSEETVAAWAGGAVISTLRAFGGRAETVENLRRLRAAGALVLYGTDLGNTREAGVDEGEIALLEEAGLDGAAILAALTESPAAYFGLESLGQLAPGRQATALVLDEDPTLAPRTLARPARVLHR